MRGGFDVGRDVPRDRVLLLDSRSDGNRDVADVADDPRNGLDRLDRLAGCTLDCRDLRFDVLGRLRGLTGESLDLRGDDGKSAAGIPSAGRFNRRVERQQIGLTRDVPDELDDLTNALRRLAQAANDLV